MSPWDPVYTLAHTMSRTADSHAFLLGAGVSKSAGIPSAWEIEETLIEELAHARGLTIPTNEDAHAWYQAHHEGAEATYQALLEGLAPSRFERQRLLKPYFEPTGEELDSETKQPSAAHRAIAELAAKGRVRIVLTTNFDHLMETALKQVGITALSVSSPEEMHTVPPLHTIDALVVHLHGDYTRPETLRNTDEELGSYPSEVTALAKRVVEDRGLVMAGWSGKYDPALADLLQTDLTRRVTSYWIEPGPLEDRASTLQQSAGILQIPARADEALSILRDAVSALEHTRMRHPLAPATAVATTKRLLIRDHAPIALHDQLHTALADLWDSPALSDTRYEPEPGRTPEDYLAGLAQAAQWPAAVIATAARWGNPTTDSWWTPTIEAMAEPAHGHPGDTFLLHASTRAATLLLYSAGIAAVAGQRFELLHELFSTIQVHSLTGIDTSPQALISYFPYQGVPSVWLFNSLHDLFTRDLTLGEHGYTEAWETLEVLRLAAATNPGIDEFANAYAQQKKNLWHAAHNSPPSEEAQEEARRTYETELASAARFAPIAPYPHIWIRTIGQREASRAAQRLLETLTLRGALHPLNQAGFLGGGDRLEAALMVVDTAISEAAHQVQSQILFNSTRSGVLPSEFWLDTPEAPPPNHP